jgi:hypothetical protein
VGGVSVGQKNCSDWTDAAFVLHRAELRGPLHEGDTVRELKNYVAVVPRKRQ